MLLKVTVLRDNNRGPEYVRQILDALHLGNRRRLPITLILARFQHSVGLCCAVPQPLQSTLEQGLLSGYEGCRAEKLPGHALAFPSGWSVQKTQLTLRPDVFPLQLQFDDLLNREFVDPITGILHRLQSDTFPSRVELTLRPASRRRRLHASRVRDALLRPALLHRPRLSEAFARAATSPYRCIRYPARILLPLLELSGAPAQWGSGRDKVRGHHLFEATLSISVASRPQKKRQALQHLESIVGSFGPFASPPMPQWSVGRRFRPFLLSSQEASILWHPVTHSVEAANIDATPAREMQPPAVLPNCRNYDVLPLGRTQYRDRIDHFGIHLHDRLRHMHIIGQTGQGKSTLLLNMAVSDLTSGNGLCLIDPHGDLYEDILPFIPKHRRDDVICFDAGDERTPYGLNLLSDVTDGNRALVADAVITTLSKVFGLDPGRTPRLLRIIRNCVLTLTESPGTSLLDIEELLLDPAFRNRQINVLLKRARTGTSSEPSLRGLKDSICGVPCCDHRRPVLLFWQDFLGWSERYRSEGIAAALNLLDHISTHPQLRSVLGPNRKQLRLREIMDTGRVLLVNLSKGRMGESASSLLGSLLVSKLQIEALGRADIPATERRPFFITIDEFQNFATRSFETMLSEARKYGLGLTLAHQYFGQIEDTRLLQAVLGNVGTILSFQVGADDAEILARAFGENLTAQDFTKLPRYTAYMRLMIDGSKSPPFSLATLKPPSLIQQVVATMESSRSNVTFVSS
jgi:hypothetical protein